MSHILMIWDSYRRELIIEISRDHCILCCSHNSTGNKSKYILSHSSSKVFVPTIIKWQLRGVKKYPHFKNARCQRIIHSTPWLFLRDLSSCIRSFLPLSEWSRTDPFYTTCIISRMRPLTTSDPWVGSVVSSITGQPLPVAARRIIRAPSFWLSSSLKETQLIIRALI